MTLRDPRDSEGRYFTEDGAWEFVADALNAGHEVEEIVLRNPANKKGYVLILPGVEPVSEIYVKLQLGSSDVLGRSFHVSKPE